MALRRTWLLFGNCKITEPRAGVSWFMAGQCSSIQGFPADGPAFLRRRTSRRLYVRVFACRTGERSRKFRVIDFGVFTDGASATSGGLPTRNAFDPHGISLLW